MRKLLVLLGLVLVFAVPASATTSRILAPMDWWPVWSPDGSHIAFTRVYANHMELFTFDTRTNRVVKVGSNGFQLAPAWSSDGSKLAYASGGVLWIANADGSGKHRYPGPARAFAPTWQPGTTTLAFLETQGSQSTDLWVGGARWALNAGGHPAWAPDGKKVAFQRGNGIYVANGPGSERLLVSINDPGAPVWSHDGTRIAYTAHQTLFSIPVSGGTPTNVTYARSWRAIGTPSWSFDDARIAFSWAGGVWVTRGQGGYAEDLHEPVFGAGAAFAPRSYFVAYSASRPGCPGHVGIHRRGVDGPSPTLTGSCVIAGTAKPDVIEGTGLWGDVILGGAGNDQIHANDGHTDRVDCGPGRDTVWADRTDRLTRCEIVRR